MLKQLHSPGDLLLFSRIFGFAIIAPLLARLKLPKLDSLLTPLDRHPPSDPAQSQKIVAYTNAALYLGRPLLRTNCLTRGLTLYYFLRRSGLLVDLCFGVDNSSNEFVGHCWLVHDGMPFAEVGDPYPRYVEVYRLPHINQLSTTELQGDLA